MKQNVSLVLGIRVGPTADNVAIFIVYCCFEHKAPQGTGPQPRTCSTSSDRKSIISPYVCVVCVFFFAELAIP